MHIQRLHDLRRHRFESFGVSSVSLRERWDSVWIFLFSVGIILLCIVNQAFDPLVVALALLLCGYGICRALNLQDGYYEIRAFLLSSSACVMVAGLSHFYSMSSFGTLQSTIDSTKFLDSIAPAPPFSVMSDMALDVKHRLAIVIWQQVYRVTWMLGLKFGPYIGILLNCVMVGLSSSVTVCIARDLFGHDTWRLRRVGTLCACCGMFWLFGGLLLRDCFCLFFSVLVLWSLVHWLIKPTLTNLILALFTVVISGVAMWYLRWMITFLYVAFCVLALFCWLGQRKFDVKRVMISFVLVGVSLFVLADISSYVTDALSYRTQFAESYETIAYSSTSRGSDSLGIQLVLNQPLLIRLILGAGMLMVYPIPLWAFIEAGVREYHLIYTYNGFYQVLVIPLIVAGMYIVIRTVRETRILPPIFFLVLFALFNTAVVASTSLELRHLGQFYPAFIVLAAMPDTRTIEAKLLVKNIGLVWFGAVGFVHLLWFILRFTS